MRGKRLNHQPLWPIIIGIVLFSLIMMPVTALTSAEITEILAEHNKYRSEVGSPQIKWSDTIATDAQNWANYEASINSEIPSGTAYGENLRSDWDVIYSSWTDVINSWSAEKQYFVYGPFGDSSSTTGHWQDVRYYTQIIWFNTMECGCGRAFNDDVYPIMVYYVCQYNPRGNILGNYPYPASSHKDVKGIFRPSAANNWILDFSLDNTIDQRDHFGSSIDRPLLGDINNDGTVDRAVFRAGQWILDYSMDRTIDTRNTYGMSGDIPLVGHMNLDSNCDRAVFRGGLWIIDHNMDGTVNVRNRFGMPGDIPLVGDFNNDSIPDRAVFRNGQWIADFDMDGDVDARDNYGQAGDVPVVGDFNKDGTTDRAVFRNGVWIIDYGMNGSVDSRVAFGIAGDIPLVSNV